MNHEFDNILLCATLFQQQSITRGIGQHSVTAAVLTTAIHQLTGLPLSALPVYDGSWTEYASGNEGNNPIDVGMDGPEAK
jgi:3-mercaptopyruvate sulfurtransferase SseA